jgi:ABC-type multidrug transport system ATPase subunit
MAEAKPTGSITGLVGRNGSGKTTLLRHVTGMVLPDEGEWVNPTSPSDPTTPRKSPQRKSCRFPVALA